MARADLWDADFVVTKPEIVTQRSAMHSIDVSTSELRQVFTNHALHPARELLPDAFIEQSTRACGLTWRNRLFNPVVTLLACVYAHLGSVASLRVVEDWFNGFLPLIARRSDGSSLCRARRRLPLGLFRRCCRRVADVASGTGGLYAFGLRVLLADGTALRLGRSESVVRHFGCHAGSRGVSRRPIARAMLVCCAGTGAVLSWMMSPFIWAERRLLYRLLRDIGPGCLLVGDAGLFSYIVLSRLIRFGSHGLFRLPAWKTGCLSRKRLGSGDHLELWERPRREHSHFPKLLRREPAYLKVRVITCLLRRKGYRDRKLRLVVTLLNARACPASDILALYGRRWDIELDIRELKRSHLPEVLRGAHSRRRVSGIRLGRTGFKPDQSADGASSTALVRACRGAQAQPYASASRDCGMGSDDARSRVPPLAEDLPGPADHDEQDDAAEADSPTRTARRDSNTPKIPTTGDNPSRLEGHSCRLTQQYWARRPCHQGCNVAQAPRLCTASPMKSPRPASGAVCFGWLVSTPS